MDLSHHAAGTATASIGGAILAQATQSPTITAGALALAVIGLASLWVRSYYGLAQARLEWDRRTDRLHQLEQEVAELRAWKAVAGCVSAPECDRRQAPSR